MSKPIRWMFFAIFCIGCAGLIALSIAVPTLGMCLLVVVGGALFVASIEQLIIDGFPWLND